jgi:uncharacterized protein
MPGKDDAELIEQLTVILRGAPSLMRVLAIARALDLPDSLIMSGAVYQRVLNKLTMRAPDYGVRDYDLAYFRRFGHFLRSRGCDNPAGRGGL